MKLEYFDLLSPDPIFIKNVGSIKSHTLKEIKREVGYSVYQLYLNVFTIGIKSFFELINDIKTYESLNDDQLLSLNIYDLLVSNESTCRLLESSLNFFMCDEVIFDSNHKIFLTFNGGVDDSGNKIITGKIDKEIWAYVKDVILQRNYVKLKDDIDIGKVTNKKTLSILKKLQKGREEKAKNNSKKDSNMDIGNIISSVSRRHRSLNILNIWDITIYQLWDAFYGIQNDNIYDIQATSVSVWGDEKKQFNAATWFKNLET